MFTLRPECIPCAFSGCLRTLTAAGASPSCQLETLQEAARLVANWDLGSSAPELGQSVQRLVQKKSGVADPYANAKKASNETMMRLRPRLREKVFYANNPLHEALTIAALANRIDFGPSGFSPAETEALLLGKERPSFGLNQSLQLEEELSKARKVVFVLDNAGEIVADSLLMEVLEQPVVAIVRGKATINDATMEDVEATGLDEYATFLHTDDDLPGMPATLPQEVEKSLSEADVIIAKGQGNFESLLGRDLSVYFLLMAKCAPVARYLGVKMGELVLTSEENKCR